MNFNSETAQSYFRERILRPIFSLDAYAMVFSYYCSPDGCWML